MLVNWSECFYSFSCNTQFYLCYVLIDQSMFWKNSNMKTSYFLSFQKEFNYQNYKTHSLWYYKWNLSRNKACFLFF
jgi:hypothetical protein